MLPLPELQQKLGQALRGGSPAGLPLRDRGIAGVQRLQVYRNNHVSALREALRAVYPVTERLVGEAFFATAADAYAASNPSRSGNIQDYGGSFPLFLGSYTPAASLPYLRDIAALEWQRLQTSIAGPHEAMDVDALAQVREGELPGLRFHHQPGAQLHASAYPILRIWVFCQQEGPSGQLDVDVGGERVLFYRIGTDTHMRRISAGEHAFLASLCDGRTFAAACEAAFAEEASFDVQAAFAVAVRNGVLTDFYL